MQSLIPRTGGIAGLYVCGDVFTYRGMHRPEIQPAKAVYLRLYSGFIPTVGIAAQTFEREKAAPTICQSAWRKVSSASPIQSRRTGLKCPIGR